LNCKENGFQPPYKIGLMKQPLIHQGWKRVLIFLICYVLLLLLSGSIWDLFPESVRNGTALPVPFLYLPLVYNFFAGTLLVLFFRKTFDRQTFNSLGLQWKQLGVERLAGILSAVVILCGIAAVLWWMQLLRWYTKPVSLTSFLSVTVLMILIAFGEELVFRGYVLRNLMEQWQPTPSLILSALVFAVFHSLNPDFNLIAFVNILLAGLVLGLNYIYTRNLWFGIFFHFAWNWLQGPVLGFEVSGLELPALLHQDLSGSIVLTGGGFGLEASWLTTIALLLAIPLLYSLFQKYYRR